MESRDYPVPPWPIFYWRFEPLAPAWAATTREARRAIALWHLSQLPPYLDQLMTTTSALNRRRLDARGRLPAALKTEVDVHRLRFDLERQGYLVDELPRVFTLGELIALGARRLCASRAASSPEYLEASALLMRLDGANHEVLRDVLACRKGNVPHLLDHAVLRAVLAACGARMPQNPPAGN